MRGRRTARIARGGQTMPAPRREKPKPAHAILLRVLISSEFLRNRTYSLAENTCLEYVHVKFASTNFIFVETRRTALSSWNCISFFFILIYVPRISLNIPVSQFSISGYPLPPSLLLREDKNQGGETRLSHAENGRSLDRIARKISETRIVGEPRTTQLSIFKWPRWYYC